MRNVKLWNGLLWGFNGLLGAGVALFAFQYLLMARSGGYLEGFNREEDAGVSRGTGILAPKSDEVIKKLRNPIEKETAGPGPLRVTQFKAALRGTMPGSKGGLAFLKSSSQNVELVAFAGEEIQYEGKRYEEFAGWILQEVTRDSATFVNGAQRQTLFLEEGAAPSPTGAAAPAGAKTVNRAGTPYNVASFRSRLLGSDPNRVVWGLDPEEVDWAFQNQDAILDRDFRVSVYAGGGLKIDSVAAGSIGAARGLVGGDVVRDVNGIPLNSLADIKNLQSNPALQQANTLRFSVERAGKVMTIEYRPMPESRGGRR